MGNIFKKIEGNLKKITSIYATKKGAGGSSDPRSVLADTTALDGCIATYRRNLDAYYKYYGFNEAEGWGYKIEKSDGEVGEGSAGGVLGTGTGKYLAATSHTVPSALYNGGQGNVLTFLSCWLCGGYYYYLKPFKFTKGHHTVTFNIYADKASYTPNTSYTGLTDDVNNFNIKYRLGTGALYNSTNSYKQSVLEFDVTEDEEELYLCFGYKSQNYGSGSMPMIALDSVEGLPGEGANEIVNICKVYNGSRMIKDFCGGGGDDDNDMKYLGDDIKNHPYYNEYFTIEALEKGTLPMYTNTELVDNYFWSKNGSEWTNGGTVEAEKGDKIRIKSQRYSAYNIHTSFIRPTFKCNVYGNINSLYAGDYFTTELTTYDYMFEGYFDTLMIVDASNLVLPYLSLKDHMYYQLFKNCLHLEKAPVLPSVKLAESCYGETFINCSSLEKAPVLPSKKLAEFSYQRMFKSCLKLNYVKCLAETKTSGSTTDWLQYVADKGTFVKKKGVDIWETDSTHGIPVGWTVEETEDEVTIDYSNEYFTIEALEDGTIPMNTTGILNNFYWNKNDTEWLMNGTVSMQAGDTLKIKSSGIKTSSIAKTESFFKPTFKFNVYGNINSLYREDDFTTNLTTYNNMFEYWFDGLGVVDASNLVLPYTELKEYMYNLMFNQCSSLEKAPVLPATTLAQYCYRYMFAETALKEAPELPATTLARGCYYGLFDSCTSLVKAPELMAKNLVNSCYYSTFYRCSSLNYVKCLAETGIDQDSSTYRFIYRASSTGTFVKKRGVTWPTGNNGITSGWTVEEVD